MDNGIFRRDFLKVAPAAVGMMAYAAEAPQAAKSSAQVLLQPNLKPEISH